MELLYNISVSCCYDSSDISFNQNEEVKVADNPILKRFGRITDKADKLNGRGRAKRFFVMTHGRNYKLTDVGLYDGSTKKYALTDVRAYNANAVLDEMEAMLLVKAK